MKPIIISIISVVLGLLVLSCGAGDEPSKTNQAGKSSDAPPVLTQGGGATERETPPETPPEKPAPRANPIVAEMQLAYRMAKQAADSKKPASESASGFASRSITGEAHYYQGLLWQLAEEHEKAAASFEKFVATSPGDLNFKWGLYKAGEELLAAGETEKAVDYIERFMQKFPDEMSYMKILGGTAGTALMAEGRFEKAVAMYQASVDAGSAYTGEHLIGALCAAGRYDDARTHAAKFAKGDDEVERYAVIAKRTQALGKKAPGITVEGWSGEEPFDTASLAGHVHLVYFWTMRAWNQSEIMQGEIAKLYDKYNGEGFRVVGLSVYAGYDPVEGKLKPGMTPEDELVAIKTWASHFSTRWPLGLCGDETNHDAWGYWRLPSLALVDASGRYRYFQGEADRKWEKLDAVIASLLDEAKK